MSSLFQSVREAWQMQCPSCGADNQIDVTAMIAVRLTPDGTDIETAEDGNHHWDDNHPAVCRACSYAGTVASFAV